MSEAKKPINENPNNHFKRVQRKYTGPGVVGTVDFLIMDNLQREFANQMEAEARKRTWKKRKCKGKRKNDQCL